MRQRRNRLEREIKAFRRDLDKQATTTRKNVTSQAELASARVENLVQSIQTTGTQVATELQKRVQNVA